MLSRQMPLELTLSAPLGFNPLSPPRQHRDLAIPLALYCPCHAKGGVVTAPAMKRGSKRGAVGSRGPLDF